MLTTPITVLLVDGYALVRTTLCQFLKSQSEIKLVITAQDYVEAKKQATQFSPEIIWLDLHIARTDGAAEIGRLRKLSPASRIMALTNVEDEQEAFAVMMAGAQGYRSRQDVDLDEIMPIIQMLSRGEFVLRPELLICLMQRLRAAAMPPWKSRYESVNDPFIRNTVFNRLTELTTEEREVLQFISRGLRDRDIAKELHISVKAMQKHVQSILSKLGV